MMIDRTNIPILDIASLLLDQNNVVIVIPLQTQMAPTHRLQNRSSI